MAKSTAQRAIDTPFTEGYTVARASGSGSTTVIDVGPHTHDGDYLPVVTYTAHAADADAHHNQAHTLSGSDHTATGLTTGWVLAATNATTFSWRKLLLSEITATTGNGIVIAGDEISIDETLSIETLTTSAYISIGTSLYLTNDQNVYWKDSSITNRRMFLLASDDAFHIGPIDSGWAAAGTHISAGTTLNLKVGYATTPLTAMQLQADGDVVANYDVEIVGTLDVDDITSSTDLSIAPTGDILLEPTGDDVVLHDDTDFVSTTYSDLVAKITGFKLYDADPPNDKRWLTISGIKAEELHVRVFVADEVRVDRGEQFWSKSFGVVEEDFLEPLMDSSRYVWFEDSPALSGNIFTVGDYLKFSVIDWATGLDVTTSWYEVNALITASGVDGERQKWDIIRRDGGVDGQTIKAGQLAIDFGAVGEGWVQLTAYKDAEGPFMKFGTWSGSNPYDGDFDTAVTIGHLSSITAAEGNDGLYVTGTDIVSGITGSIEVSEAAIKLTEVNLETHSGGNQTGSISAIGSLSFGLDIDSAATTSMQFFSSTGDLRIGRTGDGELHWDDDLDLLTVTGAIQIQSPSGFTGSGYLQVGSVGTLAADTLEGWHIDNTQIVGRNGSDVDQVVLNTDGQIVAGAGKVTLDVSGIELDQIPSDSYAKANALTFDASGATVGKIYSNLSDIDPSGTEQSLWVESESAAGQAGAWIGSRVANGQIGKAGLYTLNGGQYGPFVRLTVDASDGELVEIHGATEIDSTLDITGLTTANGHIYPANETLDLGGSNYWANIRGKVIRASLSFAAKANNTVDIASSGTRIRKIYTYDADFSGTDVIMSGLPTSDPSVAGQLWSNSNVLTVSAG